MIFQLLQIGLQREYFFQVSQLAVFLADTSHCVILLVSILAIFLGFLRVQKLKFHGEDQSIMGDWLIRFAAIGMFAYSTFNIVAGGLSVHTDLKNLLILATGGITIIQVIKIFQIIPKYSKLF